MINDPELKRLRASIENAKSIKKGLEQTIADLTELLKKAEQRRKKKKD